MGWIQPTVKTWKSPLNRCWSLGKSSKWTWGFPAFHRFDCRRVNSVYLGNYGAWVEKLIDTSMILPFESMYLGKFDHDRTLSSRTLESWQISIGKSSPSMAELFRLVNYYNLPWVYGDDITFEVVGGLISYLLACSHEMMGNQPTDIRLKHMTWVYTRYMAPSYKLVY